MKPDRNPTLRGMLERIRSFFRVRIRWLTRVSIFLIAMMVVLYQIDPGVSEGLSEFLGLSQPSLATLIGVTLVIVILERVFVIEDLVIRPPVGVEPERIGAYATLAELLESRTVRQVSLLQVSGQNVLRFLRDIASRFPHARVHLLLLHPDTASTFDSDHHPNHLHRIDTTLREIEVIENDYEGFKVETRYYNSPPSLSVIIVDEHLLAISWYPTFRDKTDRAVTRVRGHLAPTVVVRESPAHPLVAFAREHFDAVWITAEYDPHSSPAPAAV